MEAACTEVFGSRSLKGRTVAVQGVGSVGFELCKLISSHGGEITFTDISEKNISKMTEAFPSAKFVGLDEIFDVECDIYAPCALGASINDETINRLKCKIVNGAANNQLKEDRHGEILKEKGILYSPDYLINAGGLMNVSIEFEGWADSKSRRMIDTLYDTTLKIFAMAKENNITTNKAADLLAEKRIASMKAIGTNFIGKSTQEHRFPGQKRR